MESPRFVRNDPYLKPFEGIIRRRKILAEKREQELKPESNSLSDFANGHQYFGRQKTAKSWIFREWAPGAEGIQLVGDRIGWTNKEKLFSFKKVSNGYWELDLPIDTLNHTDLYKYFVSWKGGGDDRISPWAKRVIQDPGTKLFAEQVWDPGEPYQWKNKVVNLHNYPSLFIYEAHPGMASEEEKVSSYNEFRENVLPYIAETGYNVIQLMAVQEHPYYGSFGYHVSNFFAPSSRFGTPEDLMRLIDDAHGMGIGVIMDVVHSHAVKNTLEGPALFDGQQGMFFHSNHKREHPAWDSICFDYGRHETLHFLLSNCKYWLEEFRFDGFRFDGVTSMLYHDHGLGKSFSSYEQYFDANVDSDALTSLSLSCKLIKEVNPTAVIIAEDMSGMPGLAIPQNQGGIGFDFRLAMGIPDFWIKIIKEKADEQWNVNQIYFELTNKRADEKVISYAESHDQALVGDKTLIFRLADKEMYSCMSVKTPSLIIDRAIALHKMIRLATLCTNGGGYLNFMGNEFGHPEWIDFPREGNNWSYKYARRQWSLAKNPSLKYLYLLNFERDMLSLFGNEKALSADAPQKVYDNESDQVLVIQRAEYLFIFNFNPVQSFPNYGIPCTPSDYKVILSSDSNKYGGFERVNMKIILESEPVHTGSPHYQLMTYLPSRTVIIARKIPTPGARSANK